MYQESEEFERLLRSDFAKAGIDTHPCGSSRWEHHTSGVQRVLELTPNLERYLHCDIEQARILDIGCATGSASTAFAWLNCRQVVGLDLTMEPLGVRLAQRRIQAHNLKAHFINGDGCRLPCRSKSFDLCFCEWVIEHIPTQLELLNEIQRVLIPNGIAYISTNNRLWPKEVHSGLWFISWLPHNWAAQFAVWLDRCSDRAGWNVWLLTFWQLHSLAREAGLDVVMPHFNPFLSTKSFVVSRALNHLGLSADFVAPNLYVLARRPENQNNGF